MSSFYLSSIFVLTLTSFPLSWAVVNLVNLDPTFTHSQAEIKVNKILEQIKP